MIALRKNGLVKEVKTGFSWKYFFFGAWYVLYREGFWASCKHTLLTTITLSIYFWVQCFKYNNNQIQNMIEKGYEPHTLEDENYLVRKLNYQA